MSPEFMREWSLVQAYEGDAAAIQEQIDALQAKRSRVLDMAAQHRHLMELVLEAETVEVV